MRNLLLDTILFAFLAFIIGFCFECGSNLAWELFGYL